MLVNLQIHKLKIISDTFCRYYPVENVQFILKYNLFTEAQLAWYMYSKYGVGRYKIMMWRKGQKGFRKYWLGDIYEHGFCRDKEKNKEMDILKKELNKADSFEDREFIEEEIDFEREISKEEKKMRQPQAWGLVKSRPGQINEYQMF